MNKNFLYAVLFMGQILQANNTFTPGVVRKITMHNQEIPTINQEQRLQTYRVTRMHGVIMASAIVLFSTLTGMTLPVTTQSNATRIPEKDSLNK